MTSPIERGEWIGRGADYVYSNPGSITYVETAYAQLAHDPCAPYRNLPVTPSSSHRPP